MNDGSFLMNYSTKVIKLKGKAKKAEVEQDTTIKDEIDKS